MRGTSLFTQFLEPTLLFAARQHLLSEGSLVSAKRMISSLTWLVTGRRTSTTRSPCYPTGSYSLVSLWLRRGPHQLFRQGPHCYHCSRCRDKDWENTYVKSCIAARSELEEPHPRLPLALLKLWKEFGDNRIEDAKGACCLVGWIPLNKVFAKPCFGWKKDGSVVHDLGDMTYEEAALRMVHLMYVTHEDRWIDISLRNLSGDWLRRVEECFAGVNGSQTEYPAEASTTTLPLHWISYQILQLPSNFWLPRIVFTSLPSSSVLVRNLHHLILDANLEVWFKKVCIMVVISLYRYSPFCIGLILGCRGHRGCLRPRSPTCLHFTRSHYSQILQGQAFMQSLRSPLLSPDDDDDAHHPLSTALHPWRHCWPYLHWQQQCHINQLITMPRWWQPLLPPFQWWVYDQSPSLVLTATAHSQNYFHWWRL